MTAFPQYLMLAGGIWAIYVGLRSRKNLDALSGICFVSFGALMLSHQTGKLVDAICIAIGVLIIVVADAFG